MIWSSGRGSDASTTCTSRSDPAVSSSVERLRARIAELLPRPDREVELLLPYTEGSLAARVHDEGEVLAEEHTADGTRLHARVGAELASAVLPFTRVDDRTRHAEGSGS